tara:strand:- start:31 stop:276 length:246 start_codon:yes stop_codon:yes gene_type:complete
MSIEMSKETEEKLMKALSNDPIVKISNLNIQMKVSTYHRDYKEHEDMLISIGELDEGIFTMANERALLKAIRAYINDGGES